MIRFVRLYTKYFGVNHVNRKDLILICMIQKYKIEVEFNWLLQNHQMPNESNTFS